MNKRLAIIGAGYLQVPLIEKANAMGLETHVFAWEQGAVGRVLASQFYPISVTQKELIFQKCQELEIDGVISIASDLSTITVNHVAAKLGLVGNSDACTAATTNKGVMRQRLTDAGVPCPRFVVIAPGDEVGDKVGAAALSFPVVVKPTDRSGSRGVTRVASVEDLEAAVVRARQASFLGEVIVEEFVNGQEISVEFISWRGTHHYLTCTDKETTGPPNYVEMGHHQPSRFAAGMEKEVSGLVSRALEALHLENGASHTEVLITADHQLYVVEVGGRMGGDHIGAHLVPLSTGVDFVGAVIDVCLGRPPLLNVGSTVQCAGILYASADMAAARAVIGRRGIPGPIVAREKIGPGIEGAGGVVTSSGDRVGYVVYSGQEPRSWADFIDGSGPGS